MRRDVIRIDQKLPQEDPVISQIEDVKYMLISRKMLHDPVQAVDAFRRPVSIQCAYIFMECPDGK